MREEVIDSRAIKREDTQLRKLHFAKMCWVARPIKGQPLADLAEKFRAIRNRCHGLERRRRLVPRQIIEGARTGDDEHQPETLRLPFAAVELLCAEIKD